MNKKNFAPTLFPLNRDMQKTWFVTYYDKAGRKLKKYGRLNHLQTLEERLIEAERLIQEITAPDRIEKERKIGLAGQMSDLLEYKRPFMRKKGYQSYSSVLKGFARWYISEASLKKEVAQGDYIRYLHEIGLHKNTIRGKTMVLKGLVNQLIKKGLQTTNPFEEEPLQKKVKAQSKLPFTANQVTRLKSYMLEHDSQLWDAVEFLYYLYLRPNELRQLKIEDIMFEEWKVYLNGSVAKDADVIYKAIPVPMRSHILKYASYPANYYIFSEGGKPGATMLSRDHISKRHKKIMTALNFGSRYSFYSWVHTGVKNAAMSNIPIKQLQLQKGHSDLKMFNEYLKDLRVDDCEQLIADFPSI
ncbi:tyrosine-type recombinase/integrase [Parasediminibacterium paludis]|uniref:Tyrosine-type recombinase/integrase n=1 Tax=Parasediminibacterium paludis TaxID=908966 RepID=A0ABV8PVG5_9BACT